MTTAQDEYEARRRLEKQRRKARAKRPTPSSVAKGVRSRPCRVCGDPRTEVHHIVPRSSFRRPIPSGGVEGDHDLHDPANLMPLCHRHHQDHHTKGRDGRVARHHLRPAELAFVIATKGEAWADRWYPTRQTGRPR